MHHFNAHFLLFFVNDITCYVFYIYFRLWKCCWTKSKFEWFLSSKWVIKQQRQLATSTMHLAWELLTYSAVVVQEVLQRRREPWRWEAQWLTIGSWQRLMESNFWRWSSYNYRRSFQEPNINRSTVFWHLKQIGKWVPHELTASQKKS